MATDKFTQGVVGKLKGKILFAIEHQFGERGRHLFRLLSERQCKGGFGTRLGVPFKEAFEGFSAVLCEFVPCLIEDVWGNSMNIQSSSTKGGLRFSGIG